MKNQHQNQNRTEGLPDEAEQIKFEKLEKLEEEMDKTVATANFLSRAKRRGIITEEEWWTVHNITQKAFAGFRQRIIGEVE